MSGLFLPLGAFEVIARRDIPVMTVFRGARPHRVSVSRCAVPVVWAYKPVEIVSATTVPSGSGLRSPQ